jgi:Papain fold toxin 2
VNRLSDEEIFGEVGNITARFELYECGECARAIMLWLEENNIGGRIIKIQTSDGEDYIMSIRLECRGINESITLNGIHYGVEVRGRIFDNISVEGLSRGDWLKDFLCPSGDFLVEYMDQM